MWNESCGVNMQCKYLWLTNTKPAYLVSLNIDKLVNIPFCIYYKNRIEQTKQVFYDEFNL